VPAAVSVHAIGLGYETATDDYRQDSPLDKIALHFIWGLLDRYANDAQRNRRPTGAEQDQENSEHLSGTYEKVGHEIVP
jgi:hypothetical protein